MTVSHEDDNVFRIEDPRLRRMQVMRSPQKHVSVVVGGRLWLFSVQVTFDVAPGGVAPQKLSGFVKEKAPTPIR
jgi:hypothetical protein